MKTPKNLGMILLAVWLIVYGAFAFIEISHEGLILAVLAIVAGVLMLLQR